MRPSATLLRGLAVLVVVVLAAVACGSTARVIDNPAAQGAAAPGSGEDELSLSGSLADPDAPGGNVAPGGDLDLGAPGMDAPGRQQTPGAAGGAGAGGGAGAAAPAAPGDTSPSGRGGTQANRASGRGFTETKVMIGYPVSKDAGAANAAVGASGLEQGDEREILRVVVEEVNRTGGVAGREVVPVIYEVEENSAQTWEQQYQAACSYWTEDKRVFVAHVGTNFTRDSIRACLNDRGVPIWRGGFHTNADAAVYKRFPLLVEVPAMSLGRVSRTLAEDLVEQSFFTPAGGVGQMRLGLVRYESSYYDRATEQALKPALARHGIEIAEEVEVNEPNAVSDVSTISGQLSNAILRFRSRGVTHVLFLEETSLLTALFMRQAEPQEYRPRYGVHSLQGGQAGLVPNVPARQLHGAIGIGYAPVFDVPVQDAPTTPGQQKCIKLMEREGIELPSQFGRYLAMETCDLFFSLQAAGRGAGEPLSAEGLIAGLHALGDSYSSAVALRTSFAKQRHDGAAAYRRVAFFPNCTCFKYTSRLLPAR